MPAPTTAIRNLAASLISASDSNVCTRSKRFRPSLYLCTSALSVPYTCRSRYLMCGVEGRKHAISHTLRKLTSGNRANIAQAFAGQGKHKQLDTRTPCGLDMRQVYRGNNVRAVLITPIFAAPIEQAQKRRYGPHIWDLPHMQLQELWCHRRVIFVLQSIFVGQS
jgi:hypothetical protein